MNFNAPVEPPSYGSGVFKGSVEHLSEGENTRTIIIKVSSVTDAKQSTLSVRPFICQAVIPSLDPELQLGDIVTFRGKITPPNPQTDLPDEFDMHNYYFLNDITAYAFISPGDLEAVGFQPGFTSTLLRWRDSLCDILARSRLDDNTSSFLCAVLFADKSLLDPQLQLDFSTAGLAHALALSGLHVAIFAMIASCALFPLTVVVGHKFSSLLIIIILWIYAIMTGCLPPTIRAVIMASLIIGSNMLQRSHSSANALCAAAMMILLIWPKSLFEVGFQLSFMAVAAILIFADWFNSLGLRSTTLRQLLSTVGVSISAVIGTAIPVLFYFHSFPLYFLLANIPVSILLPPLMAGGALVLLFESVIGSTPHFIIASTDWLYSAVSGIASSVASLPSAAIGGIYISSPTAYAAVAALTFTACRYFFKRKVWSYMALTTALTAILFAVTDRDTSPQYEYYVTRNSFHTDIVVRHGDSASLLSTAGAVEADQVCLWANRRYRDYLGRRNLPPLSYTPMPSLLQLGDDSWVIIRDDSPKSVISHPDYLLICRGFSGDIVKVAHSVSPDSVILSSDIHPRRAHRYLKELRHADIPVRLLADRPVHRVYRPASSRDNGILK